METSAVAMQAGVAAEPMIKTTYSSVTKTACNLGAIGAIGGIGRVIEHDVFHLLASNAGRPQCDLVFHRTAQA